MYHEISLVYGVDLDKVVRKGNMVLDIVEELDDEFIFTGYTGDGYPPYIFGFHIYGAPCICDPKYYIKLKDLKLKEDYMHLKNYADLLDKFKDEYSTDEEGKKIIKFLEGKLPEYLLVYTTS